MRTCPACHAALEAQWILDVELDVCPKCGGVFLDPGDAEARGWDLAALFGAPEATHAGPSRRQCAVHGTRMERIVFGEGLYAFEVERASCCGGVFLDASEGTSFAEAAARATAMAESAGLAARGGHDVEAAEDGTITTASGAVFAAPPASAGSPPPPKESARRGAFATVARNILSSSTAPRGSGATAPAPTTRYEVGGGALSPTDRACPRCGEPMQADREGGVELDLCPACGATFLDLGDIDARGVDIGVLFGMGPEAAVARGASELLCPRCQKPMSVFDVPTIAGPLEVERAPCCGGLFLDGGEQEPFVCAARRAANEAGDRAFATFGQVVGDAALTQHLARSGVMTEVMLNTIRSRVDAMVLRMIRDNQRRARHHRRHHHH